MPVEKGGWLSLTGQAFDSGLVWRSDVFGAEVLVIGAVKVQLSGRVQDICTDEMLLVAKEFRNHVPCLVPSS